MATSDYTEFHSQRCSTLTKMLVATFMAWTAQSVMAAGFDCSKAFSKVEKLVCGNEQLSKLDEELGRAYQLALGDANLNQKPAVVAEQKAWIAKNRDMCADTDCLSRVYLARINVLTTLKTDDAEAQYVIDQQAQASQVAQFKKDLQSVGIDATLTDCNRLIRLKYGNDGQYVPRETLSYGTYGAACKLNSKPVLICSNSMLSDLTLQFEFAGNGDAIADFAERNCPFNG